MLLLADIGNTNITIAFYDGRIKNTWRLNTIPEGRGTDEYMLLLKGYLLHNHIKEPRGSVICSVVPEATSAFACAVEKSLGFEPLIVTHKLRTGLKFRIRNPRELGADRIANAVAAHTLYKGDLIVIDFGTATTFSVITTGGQYRGGAIMPGLSISADVLAEKTSKLPRVIIKGPEKVIGEDTTANILAGLVFGHAGAVERVIREIKKEVAPKVTVVATGGLAGLVLPYIKGITEVNPHLTLEGLRIIYELNT